MAARGARFSLLLTLASAIQLKDDAEADNQLLHKDIAWGLPDPGPDGFLMSRLSAYTEPGSRIDLQLGPHCTEADGNGPSDCSIRWGDVFTAMFQAHVNGGFHRGDITASTVSLNMGMLNASNPMSYLMPKQIEIGNRCQLCMGGCFTKVSTKDVKLGIGYPTVYDDAQMCSKEVPVDVEDWNMLNSSVALPYALSELKLDGMASCSLSLEKADGTKRLEASYALKANARSPAPVNTASLLGFFAERFVGEYVSLGSKQFFGAVHETLKDSPHALVLQRAVDRQDDESTREPMNSALVVNLTIRDMERASGRNISVWSDVGCTRVDDKGSMTCSIPLSTIFNLGIAIDLAAHFDEGAKMRVKLAPSLGGVMGSLASSILPKIDFEMPICGKVGVADTFIMMGQSQTVNPIKCGPWAINLELLKPIMLSIPDITNMELPAVPGMIFMPKHLSEVLPITIKASADLVHADGTTMASLDLGVQLAKM